MITGDGAVQFHPVVVLSFALNIGIFFWQLLRSVWAHPFSFDMMTWLFCLFFFGYAPLLQHMTDTYAWKLDPTIGEVIGANGIVLLWTVCYLLGRDYRRYPRMRSLADKLTGKLRPLADRIPRWKSMKFRLGKKTVLNLLLLLAICCAGVDILTVGLIEQLSRATAEAGTGNTAVDLIMTHGINNILLFVAAIYVIEAKKAKKIGWKTLIALLCLGIACFPTGLSRNMMASFYAGMLILMLDSSRRGRWFSWVIFGGLIFIFPAMEVFRWLLVLDRGDPIQLILNSFQSSYLDGHFDAHQMIISIGRYVEEYGFAWGKQILGALLFFVPRSIWPGKPEGTGHTAIVALDQFHFSNVSAPMPAEGYVNFGLVGVICIGILLGIVARRMDSAYWRSREGKYPEKPVDFLYPFAMFMFFFFLRGDMMSAWAYTFAQTLVGWALFTVWQLAADPEDDK